MQHVAGLFLVPQSEARHHGRAAVMRELGERRPGTGLNAEEVDKHPFGRRDILIDQNPDRVSRLQSPQDLPRGFFLADHTIAGEPAITFH